MPESISNALIAAVTRLLRPLVRILLRNGIPYGVFQDIARWVYADVAMREFGLPGRKPSVSRASILTGLARKEIVRLQSLQTPNDDTAVEQYNRAAAVIGGWVADTRFHYEGMPDDLPLEGGFSELVKLYSRDVPPRAVLDELVRAGAVERLPGDRIRLLTRAYLPQTDDLAKLAILGTDVKLLIATIDHNLSHTGADARFQRKVAYDNLPEEALPQLRLESAQEALLLLEHLNKRFAAHDRDANPAVKGKGHKRAGVGVYYFEEDFSGGDPP